MQKLSRDDLYSLEQYAEERSAFRDRVLNHKRNRQVPIGAHATLYFEDRLTIQYQIQEMLRVEKIFERAGIEEELTAYNPLIPDGDNLKATMMFEYGDPEERRVALEKLHGAEHRVWIQVGDEERVFALADEDLERSNEAKTSAVHFLRFQLPAASVKAAHEGGAFGFGIDHPAYDFENAPVADAIRASLAADLSD